MTDQASDRLKFFEGVFQHRMFTVTEGSKLTIGFDSPDRTTDAQWAISTLNRNHNAPYLAKLAESEREERKNGPDVAELTKKASQALKTAATRLKEWIQAGGDFSTISPIHDVKAFRRDVIDLIDGIEEAVSERDAAAKDRDHQVLQLGAILADERDQRKHLEAENVKLKELNAECHALMQAAETRCGKYVEAMAKVRAATHLD